MTDKKPGKPLFPGNGYNWIGKRWVELKIDCLSPQWKKTAVNPFRLLCDGSGNL